MNAIHLTEGDLILGHYTMIRFSVAQTNNQVWDIFLYLHLSSTNIDEQQALMNAHRSGDFDTKLALHEKYYSVTSSALLEHVDGILEALDRVIQKSDAHPIYVSYGFF